MKNKLIFILILLTSVIFSQEYSKENHIKELKGKLENTVLSDSMRFEHLFHLSTLYRSESIDSATIYIFEALRYAEKNKNHRQIGRSNLFIASIYKEFREIYRALEYEINAMNLAKASKDSSLLFNAYHSIILTNIWYAQDYDIAKAYLNKGLELAEALNNDRYKAVINYYYGILYVSLKEWSLSENYYLKSLEYHEKQNDLENIANCLNNLGDLKEKAGNLKEALKYNQKAYKINSTIGDSAGLFINTYNIASIYSKLGKHQDFHNIMETELNRALKQENYEHLSLIYELYYQHYEAIEDYKNSLNYYKLMVETNQAIEHNSKTIQVKRIEHEHLLDKLADQQKIYELQLQNKTSTLSFITLLLLLSLITLITVYIYFAKKRKLEELQIKELSTKAELIALQYKINPHFLFNSLNSISQLILKKSGHAEAMIQNLSDILRYTLTFANKETVSLEEELETVRQYLEMEKIRFQERMDFRIECEPAAKKQFIPPMIILPLVENSIKHGISKLIENGEIFVKVYEKEDQLIIFVKDNGPESEETYPVDAKKSTGFGHQSIIDRLKITYQERFRFEISENEAVYCVKISIPINNR